MILHTTRCEVELHFNTYCIIYLLPILVSNNQTLIFKKSQEPQDLF